MQPEQKKVCNGECAQCEVNLVTNCCNSEAYKQVYINNGPELFVPICAVCKKESRIGFKVTKKPEFVARSFDSSYKLAKFLDNYSKYHDFDIVSQQTTSRYSSGLFGLFGSSYIVYSITLKNK